MTDKRARAKPFTYWADGTQGGLGFHKPPLSTHNKRQKDIMDLDDFHEHMDRKDLEYQEEQDRNEYMESEDGESTFYFIGDWGECEACEDTGIFEGDDGETLICDECVTGKQLSGEVLKDDREQRDYFEELQEFLKGNSNEEGH